MECDDHKRHQLQLMAMDLSASYALSNNIDMQPEQARGLAGMWNTATGFAPVGMNGDSPFAGKFDGLNHTISNLYINRPDESSVGLFGYTDSSGAIRNVRLSGGSVSAGGTGGNAGALVGTNFGSIDNVFASSDVSGGSTLGGLVGDNNGSISNSYASGDVTSTAGNVGGLVGHNGSGSSIAYSYASGAVVGVTGNVGGLLGHNESGGSVSNSYAIGSVSGSSQVGGLVGLNNSGSTISNSYSTGVVSGSSYYGGLVGMNIGTVDASFWDTDVLRFG